MKVEYRYDSEGYPPGKTTINPQNTPSDGKTLRERVKAGLHGSQPGG